MVVSSTTVLKWCYSRIRIAAAVAAVAAVGVAVVAAAVVGRCSTMCRVFSLPCFVCLSPFFLFSPLPLRLSGSPEPVRLLFWLLARFVDGLAPSACVVRCRHGSTMRFATMSCVCSIRGSRHSHALKSHLLQRISLALFSLFLPHAPLAPSPRSATTWASTSSPVFSAPRVLWPLSPAFLAPPLLYSPLFFPLSSAHSSAH